MSSDEFGDPNLAIRSEHPNLAIRFLQLHNGSFFAICRQTLLMHDEDDYSKQLPRPLSIHVAIPVTL